MWMNFLSQSIMGFKKNSFGSVVFKQGFLHEKCHVVVDGFDEICPKYKEKVMDFIKVLSNTNLKSLYVSTRPQMKEYLEDNLNVLAFEFKPFDERDQIQFLTQYFNDENKAEQIIAQLPNHLNGNIIHIAGIPLLLKMIADILQESESDNITEFFENFGIGYLYDQFVEKKHEIYITEKQYIRKYDIYFQNIHNELTKNCERRYFAIALKTLFNKAELEEISFKPLDKEDFPNTGIILKRGNQYEFIHRTFAEYFAAKFFLENKNATNLNILFKTVFVEKCFETIRTFCNAILRKDGIFQNISQHRSEIDRNVMSEFFSRSLNIAFEENNKNISKLLHSMYPLQE
jgi:predicted NACHT family NTPase